MKVFNFTRIEYHEVERYFITALTEDEIRYILSKAGVEEDQHDELIAALESQEHPRHKEAFHLILESQTVEEQWMFDEEISISEDEGNIDADIALESVEIVNDEADLDGYTGTLH